jgi:hypothetical protein
MEGSSPFLQEATVGHLVGESVLEGIGALGDESRLIKELGRLQLPEFVPQLVLGHSGNCLEQGPRHFWANDRRGL